jgi:outer membrane translocation and assembly module TamA
MRRQMNLSNLFFTIIFLFLLQSCASAPKSDKLCPKIYIHSKDEFELTDTEKRLICGDAEVDAYKVIPSYQASYILTGLLQSRGYSQPRFEYEGDLLHVYPESQSHVKHVIVLSDNDADNEMIAAEIMRKYGEEIITPKLLDAIEAESLTLLRNNTYPCAKVTSIVDASVETVTIKLTGLESFTFGIIEKEEINGVYSEALDRFYPFIAADFFTEKKLNLAEKRFLRSGVVQGTYFQEKCDLKNKTFTLAQQFIPGTSRTIRLGIGATTEVGPMMRARWSNQRSGNMASLLEATLQVSFKNQYFSFTSDRYLWRETPRQSLLTTFEIERDDQATYLETKMTLRPHLKWTRDGTSRLWTWSTGPTLIYGTYSTNADDSDTKRVKTGAIEGMIQTQSHAYEFFDLHPEAGDFLQFNFDFRHPSMGFQDPLLKLDLSYLSLVRIGNLGKGSAIGGIRLNSSTTWVPDEVTLSSLPPSVKFYGGGSDDIRGFRLSTLPDNNGLGALTKLSLKFEFRKTYVFIPTIESFTFVDTTYFGFRPWEVENRIWYSPGTGLRWLSPIGILQGYVARGLSNQEIKDNGNYFYLGLGGVF